MKRHRMPALLLLVVLLLVGVGGLWLWQGKQQYARNRALIVALVNNDVPQAFALVNAGADPNTRYNPPSAPSVTFLLQRLLHHSPPPVDDSPTAFLLACGTGWLSLQNQFDTPSPHTVDPQLVQAMLSHGAILHPKTTLGETALYGAVIHNQTRVAELLLRYGADANERCITGGTLLMMAVEMRSGDMARLLLAHHADINAKDDMENTALFHAVYAIRDKEMVQLLLAHHADPNVPGRYEQTVLTHLWESDQPDIVALLRRKR
jgi:ankyrin repeat protein